MKTSDQFKPRPLKDGEYYVGGTQIGKRARVKWGVESDGSRRCTKCLKMKPLDRFDKQRSQCKPCRAARTAGGSSSRSPVVGSDLIL